jgi:very-short-patch-repair endonuclease
MTTSLPELDSSHQRAISLFTYLKELSALRTRMVRTVDSYESVVWLADIPRERECFSASWFAEPGKRDEDSWIRIDKPRLPLPHPEVPDELALWLDPTQVIDSTREFPELQEQIDGPNRDVSEPDFEHHAEEPEDSTQRLEDHPEVRELWETYVQDLWWPWAEEDRKRRAVQSVYSNLFSMYQRQQRLGEQFEVVLAIGLLNWRTASGQIVQRHLVTAQTSLVFDPIKGTLTVEPAGEGAKPGLEQDMLEPTERPDLAEQKTIEQALLELGDDVWQEDRLRELLSAWVHAVSPFGRYEGDPNRNQLIDEKPTVRLTPALILRRRTERSLIRTFQEIIDRLEEGAAIPAGVLRLIDVVDDAGFAEPPVEDGNAIAAIVDDVYFPLPANDEQLEIVERLQSRQGVLVQGPPGTGKSHTIANLVSHLLATGQRVLVTSHTARALRVLHEKIPDAIADLCVSLIGDDRAALRSLEDSVHGITDRHVQWDSRRNAKSIEELKARLAQLRSAEALVVNDLLRLREAETYKQTLPFGGYVGTAEKIAQRVAAEAPMYCWIGIRPAESEEPPLSDLEASRLLALLRDLTEDRVAETRMAFVASNQLLNPEEFARLVHAESLVQNQLEATGKAQSHLAFQPLKACEPPEREELRRQLEGARGDIEFLRRHPEPWIGNAMALTLAGRRGVWEYLREITVEHLNAIESNNHETRNQTVVGIDGHDKRALRTVADGLLQHLEIGKGLGFGPIRPEPVKRAKYLLENVTVDGRRCDQPDVLRHLLSHIDTSIRLEELDRYWNPHTKPPVGTAQAQVAGYKELLGFLEQVLTASDRMDQLRATIGKIPKLEDQYWFEPNDIGNLIGVVDSATYAVAAEAASQPFRTLATGLHHPLLQPNPHPVLSVLEAAIEQRDIRAYADAYGKVQLLEQRRIDLDERGKLLARLRAKAPVLTDKIVASLYDPIWDERMVEFSAAWNWARADSWLGRLHDRGELEGRTSKLKELREQMRDTVACLAAEKSWRHCFERMTEFERQSLMAWMAAMRRIGKGTGIHAPAHRRAARMNMDNCRSAIPAWIMPIYRVAETIRPGKDAFDVVIVDEASQSGPEALFLQFIAKQIVVVGDDKQISPDFVGISRGEVEVLREQHISDLPFSDALGVDNSFFDQAVIRFGGRIRLREHFRCMPEIIQFSNLLCYRSEPLVPLRQFGADRLEPIKVVHVPDGYRQGTDRNVMNPPEAQAIVDQIAACCADPAYDEKSMGVISLQGDAQARRIEALLLDAIGPEEFEKRRLVCGDAYAFQGDERDVIFLSLVAAVSENHRIGTLSNARDERRFNVAASRARDQVWLFHSATLSDLSPNCLRYRLLEYFLNPNVGSNGDNPFPPDNEIVDPFDSLFEQHVFTEIQKRGYRVLPQFEVAGYRIDLVVEGMQGRLAVECDGERWHGPERFDYDMARQRQLERCGWTFWRVRGSAFYRDREGSLEGLWETLERLGIHPSAAKPEQALAGALGDAELEHANAHEYPTTEETAARPHELEAATPENVEPTSGNGLVTQPAAEPGVVAGRAAPEFLPYLNWDPQLLPNPELVSLDEVLEGLEDIIASEGPMPCFRAYPLYARAAGFESIGSQLRSAFNKAIYRGIHQHHRLTDRDETGTPGQMDRIVRLTGTPAVLVRERGNRSLNEIPPSEIAAALLALAGDSVTVCMQNQESYFLELLSLYGLARNVEDESQSLILKRAMPWVESVQSDAAVVQSSLFSPIEG